MLKEEVAKINLYSNAMMIATSIHHIYGAVIYHTPWRLHVLIVSMPMIIVSIIASRLLIWRNLSWKTSLLWSYRSIVLIFSVILIGGFEGVYNHLLKNIFFFSGVNKPTLIQMFPPPTYVMPNDVLFEITGVLQAFIFVPLLLIFLRFLKRKRME